MKSSLSRDILERCKMMRHNQTDAETKLWYFLRNRGLAGAKFRRQHPIGRYIVDFYCHEAQLAVELDGGGHAEQKGLKYDEQRTKRLEALGIRVLRFWDSEVFTNMEAVLEVILASLTRTLSLRERGKKRRPSRGEKR